MATIKSIEEKAKRYDEAIKRVEDIVGGKCPKPFVFTEGLFDYIFPELKESENKRMIQYFKDLAPFDKADELYEKYGFSHKDAIAWLEKQGEQKLVPDWMPKFLDELRSKKNYFDWDEHRDIEGGILAIIKWMNPNYFNGKDDGHKPTDKIEPRQEKLTEFERAVKQVMEEAIECGDTHNLKADAEMLLSLIHNSSWSEEDEEMLNSFLHKLEVCDLLSNKECIWIRNKFKALKDRVQPQNGYNPYKEVVESIAVMCKHYDKANHSGLRDFYDNVKVKCKDAKEYDSLYPHNTWKPSDEQVKAVKEAACYSSVFSEKTIDNLISLSKQLKTLREE